MKPHGIFNTGNPLLIDHCPNCGARFKDDYPYVMCNKCHIFCETCINKLSGCPICNTEFKSPYPIRNKSLREIINREYEKEAIAKRAAEKRVFDKMVKLINGIKAGTYSTKNIRKILKPNNDRFNPNMLYPFRTPLMDMCKMITRNGMADMIIEFINLYKDTLDPNYPDKKGLPTTQYILSAFWTAPLPEDKKIELLHVYVSAFSDKIKLDWESNHQDDSIIIPYGFSEKLIDAFIAELKTLSHINVNAPYCWADSTREPLIFSLIRNFSAKKNGPEAKYIFRSLVSAFKNKIDPTSIIEFAISMPCSMDNLTFLINTFQISPNNGLFIKLVKLKPTAAAAMLHKCADQIDINETDKAGNTAVFYAINRRRKIFKHLIHTLADKIDINQQFGKNRQTIPMIACIRKPAEIKNIVAVFGDDIDNTIADINSNTLIDVAAANGTEI